MLKSYYSACLIALTLLLCSSCGNSQVTLDDPYVEQDDYSSYGYGEGYGYDGDHTSIVFEDSAKSNSSFEAEISELSFTNLEGKPVTIKELSPGKSVVLVIIRGATGAICPYCSTQTSRLISNYKKFTDLGAEVIVVYPVDQKKDASQWEAFMASTKEKLEQKDVEVPFPVLLDVELKAVAQLGIRKDLSKPATYILDPQGQVQFAYVGATFADRPSIKSMIEQLERINASQNQPEKTDAETKD